MTWRTVLFCILLSTPVWAQPTDRGRPVLTDERITLTSDTPMDQALRVIQTFANQIIIDPQHRTTPIGVFIDRQPWRQALYQIAEHHGMEVWQREQYFELVSGTERKKETREAAPDATLDSREVIISAVFFQADRAALRDVGIDWSTLSGGRVDVRAAHLGARQVTSDQFVIGARADINRSVSIDVLLKALESQNMGEIVANPQVKVQSGKKGYIQVGADFSVTTADFAGNAITQFFSTGTILTVTPQIVSQENVDFVTLDVEAERSALVDPVRNLISKTVARTSALLKNGEQTAIGGLYGHEVNTARSGIPLLKDLPGWFFGLRYLFGHNNKQVQKTELIVLLKVEIVPSVRERIAQATQSSTYEIIQDQRQQFEALLKEPEQTPEQPPEQTPEQ